MKDNEGISTRKISVKRTRKILKSSITPQLYDEKSTQASELFPENQRVSRVDLTQGELINHRYEVITKLGSGNFGTVYKVLDIEDQSEKAIKFFHAKNEVSPKTLTGFKQAIERILELSHPHIAKSHDYSIETKPYLVMELVEGDTIGEILSRRKLTGHELSVYSLQLAEALDYAYKKGVCHHDINQQNTIIDKSNSVKLTDFEVADTLESDFESFVIGTDNFLAPEKFKDGVSGFSTDIFALGVLFYYMKYRSYPFKKREGEQGFELKDKVLNSQGKYELIIKKCLSFFPEDRYTSYQDLISDLNSWKKQRVKRKRLVKYVDRYILLRDKPADFRKDVHLLALLLISAVALFPLYLRYSSHSDYHEYVTVDPGRYSLRVNFIDRDPSLIYHRLRRGDLIQLVDSEGVSYLDYYYRGEKYLIFRRRNNSFFLNNQLVGKVISTEKDLPIPGSLKYIHTEIELSAEDLRIPGRRRINFSIGENVTESTLENLNGGVVFLNISRNERIGSFEQLSQTGLGKIAGLDASKVETHEGHYFDLTGIEKFNQVRHLNLSNTGLADSADLAGLSKLEHLSIMSNSLNDLEAIADIRRLSSLNLSNNRQVADVGPLSELTDLVAIEIDNLPKVAASQIERLKRDVSSNVKKTAIRKFQNGSFSVFLLLKILLLTIIFLLLIQTLSILIKNYRMPARGAGSRGKRKQAGALRGEAELNLADIDQAIADEKLYSPEDGCALSLLKSKIIEYPMNRQLIRKQKEIIDLIVNKYRGYYNQEEYEPAYLVAHNSRKIMDFSRLQKMENKSKKKLLKNDPLKFKYVKGGKFMMGDFAGQGYKNAPAHQICLDGYYISETVITNQMFCDFLNETGNRKEEGVEWLNIKSTYSRIKEERGYFYVEEPYQAFPVFEVCWYGAQRFCQWAGGRLPTEAEWEFAARNRGIKILYSTGKEANIKKSNYLIDENDDRWHSVKPVKSYKPNKIGLYEMSGNILEWCYDYFHRDYYKYSPKKNPEGPLDGSKKVVRGGGWCFGKENMKTFYRGSAKPITRNNFIGFRVVRTEEPV